MKIIFVCCFYAIVMTIKKEDKKSKMCKIIIYYGKEF